MILEPIPPPLPWPPELRVATVGPENLAAWQRCFAGGDDALPRVARTFNAGLAADLGSRLFAGFVDGRLVGTSWAVRSGRTVGVDAVGTEESVRGRGFGTAMTWACLAAGRGWGCRVAILQSTRMAVGLYERLGFRTMIRCWVFMPRAEA